MDVFMDLLAYFGINLVGECETFPEMLQAFFYTLFAIYLVVFIFRALFAATWKLSHELR